MVHVDFTGVQGGFEPLPEGKYPAVVFKVEQRPSQSSSFPYLNWEFKVQGGEFDGRRAWYVTSLSPQALWKLKQVLMRLGFSKEQLEGEFDLDLADLPGLECVIVIAHEDYNGETKDRVIDVLSADAVTDTGGAALFR